MKKPLGAADERIAALKKAKELVGSARDADAHAFACGADGMVDFTEPEFLVRAKVDAIVAAVDLQRLRQTSRAAREIAEFRGFAMALHDFDAVERLERANENGGGGFGRFTHDVEHEVVAVIEKNVDMAGREIHRADARRWPAKMVSSRIARRIRLGLNDAATDTADREIVHDHFANQEARELNGVFREFGAPNPANRDLWVLLL